MRIKTAGKLIAAVIVFIALLSTSIFVRAQENTPVTLTVSPPIFELSANPGDTLKNSVRLENPTDVEREVTVDIRNFKAYGEEGSVDLTAEDTSYSLKDWMTITPSGTVTLKPKSSQTYNFTIAVPTNAEPGGHFGSIVFKTKASGASDGSGARVEQELGSLVLVKVAGDIDENIAIESFNAVKDVWEKGPVDFEARLKNNGNVHTKPTGTITITNIFGKKVDSVPIEEKNILPGAVRKIAAQWNPSGFTIGRYSANISVVFGSDNQIVTATTTFWVIPYRLLIIAAAILILLVLFLRRYRSNIRAAFRAFRGKRMSGHCKSNKQRYA